MLAAMLLVTPAAQPVLGSFGDVWEARQESDIIRDDPADKFSSQPNDVENVVVVDGADSPSAAAPHAVLVTRHNPYSLHQPFAKIYACECQACAAMSTAAAAAAVTADAAISEPLTVPAAAVELAAPGVDDAFYDDGDNADDDEHAAAAVEEEDEAAAYAAAAASAAVAAEPVSRFMPPPPPRRDTYDVIAACGAEDPDAVIYAMMMRWFTKAVAVEPFFVDEACPRPDPSRYDFVTWCDQVNAWWFRHFEHRQKKVHRHHHW